MHGAGFSPLWGLPFAGTLLSIAFGPLLAPRFWHRHQGKVLAGWALAFLLPLAAARGADAASGVFAHALVEEYVPFVALLAALFTVAGGIHMRGRLHGTPGGNTLLLAAGAGLASVMGTTGASMLLIRPLLRANDGRRHRAHVVVFFIFIVANVGGALTPLGDPPLFLGFLRGVGFFWPARRLWPATLGLLALLLALFYVIDAWRWRSEPPVPTPQRNDGAGFGFEGKINGLLLAAIVGLVLLSGTWKTPAALTLGALHIGLPALVRDVGLVAIIGISLLATPARVRAANQFSWAPMTEVATLFAGIFLTIVPVLAMLQAGSHGPFGVMLAAVARADGTPDPARYFWATGLLSSFLDNAPTYLAFFNAAGGDAQALMNAPAPVLAAISAGAVFMGANTYIGNAPNLMVKAIAQERGVALPGFFGYMLWSGGILLPSFLLITFLWFA